MRPWLLGGFAALTLTLPVAAAPLFPDVPDAHWAADAVRALAARGLLEGYPDGTFKGDRAASRWEVAMIVARFLARMEQEHATFASKAELEEVRKLYQVLREELDAFGVRITNLEENASVLDKRVSELERITFYGRLHFVAVSQNLEGAPLIGTATNPGIDWSSGRLLIEGKGLSGTATLGVNAAISEDVKAGAEFVAFTSQGSLGVDSYWGASAPWLANPWTGRGALQPNMQPDSNVPFTRMVLDNFWVRHIPSNTRLTLGSFQTERVSPFVLQGPRNPNIHRPRWLPFFGADVKGDIGEDTGLKYEAYYSLLPEFTNYGTKTAGGTLRYEFERGHVSATFNKAWNEANQDGNPLGAGLVRLPFVPFTGPGAPPVPTNAWLDSRTGLPRQLVGPQDQVTAGVEVRYRILEDEKLDLLAEYGHSSYCPDRTRTLYNTNADGNLFRFGVLAEPLEGLSLQADYLRVDPTYDPFIAAYPLPPNVPVFLPYGAYYSNYYQLHDYLNYPNNRQGGRFTGSYLFNDKSTRVRLDLAALSQVRATTPGQVLQVGNIEPLFPMLQAGGTQLGRIYSVGVGLEHRFDFGLRLNFDYFHYGLSRDGPAVDNVDIGQDVVNLQLAYPLDEELTARAGYYFLNYRGHSGLLNTDFHQQIPGVGLDWEPAPGTTFSVDYRYFDLSDRQIPLASYDGSQLIMEMKVDF